MAITLTQLNTFLAVVKGGSVTAAADELGGAPKLWRAAGLLGIGSEAAEPAAVAGLVDIGTRVQFRHALVRSAIYRSAPLADRRAVHRALANATEPELDPDRRAFLKRMAIGAAVAPAVVSFSMAALSAQPAYAAGSNLSNGSNIQPTNP